MKNSSDVGRIHRLAQAGCSVADGPPIDDAQWPSLCVVIPCHNCEKWIARAIQSVLDQNYPKLEIIVVDDGSTDASLEIIKSFGDKIRWETGPNQGACAARNRGIALTQASYVIFLDADDYVEGDLLSSLVEIARSQQVDVVFGPFCFEAENGERSRDIFLHIIDAENLISAWLCGFFVPPCAVVWRASIFKRVGAWNLSIPRNQDGELVLRALCSGARFSASTQGRGVYYCHNSANRISSRRGLAVSEAQLSIYEMVLRHAEEKGSRTLICAVSMAYYNLARNSYREGNLDAADRILEKARALGFGGHYGTLWHQVASSFLGLRRKEMFATFLRRRFRQRRDGLTSINIENPF